MQNVSVYQKENQNRREVYINANYILLRELFNQIYENILHTYIYTHNLTLHMRVHRSTSIPAYYIYANYNELYILYMSIDVANYIECL